MADGNGVPEKSDNKYRYNVNKGPAASKGFSHFLYNEDKGTICGRTVLSWAKLLVFYVIFYICLAVFSLLLFWVFWQTIPKDRPRWLGAESLIGTNPGVGYRPQPDQEKNEMSTLIWFNRENDKLANNSYWAQEIQNFFKKYYGLDKSADLGKPAKCAYGKDGPRASKDVACDLDITELPKSCTYENNGYGYANGVGQPCVLIKLNKIFGWTPIPYKTENLEKAKEKGMPAKIIEKIRSLGDSDQVETVWISCEGENPADRENIGPLTFWAPGFQEEFPGLPNYYFPYMAQIKYRSPFVFVKFEKPQPHVLIQVECKAWAMNIEAERQLQLGSVHFELMID